MEEVPLIPELPPPEDRTGAVAKPGYVWEYIGDEWRYIPRSTFAETVTDMPAVSTRPQAVLSPGKPTTGVMPPIPDGFYLWEPVGEWDASDPFGFTGSWELPRVPYTPPVRKLRAVATAKALVKAWLDGSEIITGWVVLLLSVLPVLGYIGWLYIRGLRHGVAGGNRGRD